MQGAQKPGREEHAMKAEVLLMRRNFKSRGNIIQLLRFAVSRSGPHVYLFTSSFSQWLYACHALLVARQQCMPCLLRLVLLRVGSKYTAGAESFAQSEIFTHNSLWATQIVADVRLSLYDRYILNT